MSVDVKSLRIGSHLLYEGSRVRLDRIDSSKIDNECKGILSWDFDYHDLYKKPRPIKSCPSFDERIQPIPITSELLTELGFKYHEYDNGKLWEWRFSDLYKAYGYLEFDEDTTSIWRGRLWYMKEVEIEFKVEFLHELENIFYMFYGKELIQD